MSATKENRSIAALLKILRYQSFAMLVMGGAIAYLGYSSFSKRVEVIGIQNDGRVVPVVALDKPYVSESRVTAFGEECLRKAFSHDFENFRQTITGSLDCFTQAGSENYQREITSLIEEIRTKQMVMSVTMTPPVVQQIRVVNGVYTWIVQTRLTIYRVGTKTRLQPASFTTEIEVRRIPLDQNIRGLAISRLTVKPTTETQ